MEALVIRSLSYFDLIRAQILRSSLSFSFLRSIFYHRSSRLELMYLAATLFYLAAALFFPLWVLVIGPIVWGIPHILSSIRYTPMATAENKSNHSSLIKYFIGLWLLVTLLRVAIDEGYLILPTIHLPRTNGVELLGALAIVLTLPLFIKVGFKKILQSALIVSVLAVSTWLFPAETIGVLVLGHNFVAFAYWFQACKTKADKALAWRSFAWFTLIHVLVLSGAFDFLYKYSTPQTFLGIADLDFADLGSFIAPFSENSDLWFHLVVVYAFGQAMHYFVWLKAIPELKLKTEYPVSFHLSWQYLKRDFGKKTVYFSMSLIAVSVLAWIFVELPEARILYFWAASFHGYMEIAGLGFLQFNKTV